jgi:Protein of unknown function (DUF2808)
VKNLKYFSIIAIILLSMPTVVKAHGMIQNTQLPHLIYGNANPRNARIQDAVYEIRLHVGKQSLSRLSIQVPEGMAVTRGIDALNSSNQKLDVSVRSSDAKQIVSFAQPVSSEENLTVKMKVIRTGRYENIWLFPVSVNLMGMDAELPLGTVRIATQL